MATNAVVGKPIMENVGKATLIAGGASVLSGEAAFYGAGGAVMFGDAAADGFGVYSAGLAAGVSATMDPDAKHGFATKKPHAE